MTDPKLPEVTQRSDEWFKARLGKVTASRVGDILATIRNGNWAASRKNYAAQLITERLNPENLPEPYDNEYMAWGREQEPAAREAYEKSIAFSTNGLKVQEVGFIDHPDIPMAGASPDGFVGEDSCLEIKCPTTATHIETVLSGEIPEKHKLQMLWQMACSKRNYCDFVSFDPRLPEKLQLFIREFVADPEEIERVEDEVKVFLAEVDATVRALQAKMEES